MPIELTECQEDALKALDGLSGASLQDWADAYRDGVTVTAIQGHKGRLAAHGLVETTPGKSRSTRLTAAGRRYLKKAGK